MKRLITFITISLLISKAKANDSTARVHMDKAKNCLIGSLLCLTVGGYATYQGALNDDKGMKTLGNLSLAASVVTATMATWHYQAAVIEVNAGIKSVGIRVRF